ncbi:serine hydrolase domain-containing protein [Steroidobacter flavus]|uniref:Serine hydrolase domain-containing protein n=1 Tax=Steroidobacter flavus TaxID=1842136 RepID=A0ABV8SJU3_9GAMM
MNKLAITVAAAGLAFTAGSASAADYDAYAKRLVRDWPVTGMAVAIVRDDRIKYLKGFGVRSAESGGAVDSDTLFELASISKPLSSALIGTYVDQKKLDWSDHVIDRLPWFRLSDPWLTAEVRLEDVLSHRVGVEVSSWMLTVPELTWEESARRLRYLPQKTPFRTAVRYDNFMYSVGGLMITERGDDYSAAMQERVFKPANMTRSVANFDKIIDPKGLASCHECELPDGALSPEKAIREKNVALLHVPTADGSKVISWRHVASTPASAAMSSAHDMAQFMRMMLNKGEVDGRRVLSEHTVSELLRPRAFVDPEDEEPLKGYEEQERRIAKWVSSYALGWWGGRYGDIEVRQHGGTMLGVATNMVLVPERNLGIIVLTNERVVESGHSLSMLFHLLDVELGLKPLDWPGYFRATRAPAKPAEPAKAVSNPLGPKIVGQYCHDVYGTVWVRGEGDVLTLEQGPQRSGKLTYVRDNQLALRWNGPRNSARPVGVELGQDGQATAVTIERVRFPKCKS